MLGHFERPDLSIARGARKPLDIGKPRATSWGKGASMQPPKACFFDVFGTLVDWRTSIAREAEAILKPLGHSLDWLAFADAWRDQYQPAMQEIRSGSAAFCKLDILHRRNLEKILPAFNIPKLDEATMRRLNLAWHRLDAW